MYHEEYQEGSKHKNNGDLDRCKSQLDWQEGERKRAAVQMAKLGREAEFSRQEVARMQTLLAQREKEFQDFQRQSAKTLMEEKEGRQREKRELDEVLANERREKEQALQERVRLELRLDVKATEMMNLSKDLFDCKDAKADIEKSMRQLREEKHFWQRQDGDQVLLEWEGLTKGLLRAQLARRSIHNILANIEGSLKHFRRQDLEGELSRGLIEATLSVEASKAPSVVAATSGEGSRWEGLVQDLQRLVGNVMGLSPRLQDEIEACMRESEVLSTELEELLGRARSGASRCASSAARGGARRCRLEPNAEAPTHAPYLSLPASKAERKIQLVDHVADATAHGLRSMARSHLQNARSLVRSKETERATLASEIQEYKRQASTLAAETKGAIEARARAETEMRTMQSQWGQREEHVAHLEKAMEEQKQQIEEKARELQVASDRIASLREEGESLRAAWSQAREEESRLNEALATQAAELQQVIEELSHRREDVQHLMDKIQTAEAAVETSRHRESDALLCLESAKNEVELQARRCEMEEERSLSLEEVIVRRWQQDVRRRQAFTVWHAWRIHLEKEKLSRVQRHLLEAQDRVAMCEDRQQAAEIGWEKERLARERQVDGYIHLLDRHVKTRQVRAIMRSWRARARELAHRRRDLHNYLKQFVLRKRLAAAHLVAEQLEERASQFSRALEEAEHDRKAEQKTGALELADVRAQSLMKDEEMRAAKDELESLRTSLTAASLVEEQLRAREEEVLQLQHTLDEIALVQREAEEEVANRCMHGTLGLGRPPPEQSTDMLLPSPTLNTLQGAYLDPNAVALLLARTRRAEKEKEDLALELQKEREDVRVLSREVEFLTQQTGATLPKGGFEARGDEQDREGQVHGDWKHQSKGAHTRIGQLEWELALAQEEADEKEKEVVEALEDVEALEQHLTAQNETVWQLQEMIKAQEGEMKRIQAVSDERERCLVALSRGTGFLEKERVDSHGGLCPTLPHRKDEEKKTGNVCERTKEGVFGSQEMANESTDAANGDAKPAGPRGLLAEVRRLKEALEESLEDRVTLEQQLADVLREREELIGGSRLMGNEVTVGGAALTGQEGSTTPFRVTTDVTNAKNSPFLDRETVTSAPSQPSIQPQSALPFSLSFSSPAPAHGGPTFAAPSAFQDRELQVHEAAQDLHRAVQRSQERIELLLDEGDHVSHELAAAITAGRSKEKGATRASKGKKKRKKEEGKERRARDTLMSGKSEKGLNSGEKARRQRMQVREEGVLEAQGQYGPREKHAGTQRYCDNWEKGKGRDHGATGLIDGNNFRSGPLGEDWSEAAEDAVGRREELVTLIASTQAEVDATTRQRPQSVDNALKTYLQTLKESLARLETHGSGRTRGTGRKDEGTAECSAGLETKGGQ
ncbi:hypothetical protein NSK_002216 [Nannochloropsis salina CCMP1776]|uniref:Uncharacterized protein n=1 Tax=Nannochloropsis salina CCMP1776 TaxID=1027361 RepID=A0A4D9DDA3_9STRA|nr:hypothetical protein NSK_002216 [Nannochloropsis salina CCMP1776]|eukprot:TFJ86559.1 hypothetical protein NSK_002216 [Nannochloropsis salina CCMP1776]